MRRDRRCILGCLEATAGLGTQIPDPGHRVLTRPTGERPGPRGRLAGPSDGSTGTIEGRGFRGVGGAPITRSLRTHPSAATPTILCLTLFGHGLGPHLVLVDVVREKIDWNR